MSIDFAAQRATMVESQVRVADVTDYAIQDAMRVVPRETLLAPEKAYLAYADAEVDYAPGRWLLRPRFVGQLLQGLKPRAGERALAIAAPYAGAVLAAMGLEVARQDAADAIAPGERYDLIVCEGALSAAPAAWKAALTEPHGRLGVVERNGPIGRAVLYLHADRVIGRRDLFDCAPPLMPGFEPAPAFTF